MNEANTDHFTTSEFLLLSGKVLEACTNELKKLEELTQVFPEDQSSKSFHLITLQRLDIAIQINMTLQSIFDRIVPLSEGAGDISVIPKRLVLDETKLDRIRKIFVQDCAEIRAHPSPDAESHVDLF